MRASLAWILTGIVAACGSPTVPSASPETAVVSPAALGSPGPAATESEAPSTALNTPSPTAPVLPSTQPTGPSWTPRPAEALLLDSIVSVRVDRLNLRAKPTVDSKIQGVVEKGDFLFVDVYGPFSHDGYTWYHAGFVGEAVDVPTFGVNVRGPQGQNGWIAVAKGDSSYVKRLRPRCPATIDTVSMQHMLGSELLACFGPNTIELTGTFGCPGFCGEWLGSYEPGWLAYPSSYPLAPYPIGDNVGDFGLRLPPGIEAPPGGSVLRVRGHFDDPASATCAISIADPMHPNGEGLVAIPRDAARLVCAQRFVVESLEILGTDPGFTFG